MKRIYMVLVVTLVVGCTPEPEKHGKYTNNAPLPGVMYEEACLNNVVYYNSSHHLAPAFKPDGTLYTC